MQHQSNWTVALVKLHEHYTKNMTKYCKVTRANENPENNEFND